MFEGPNGRWYATKRDYDRSCSLTRVMNDGWGMIDGYTRYAVSPQGEVMNLQTLRLMSIRTHSYNNSLVVSLLSDGGQRSSVSLARVVANTYLPFPDDVEEVYYDVGYLDGNNQNVNVDNLVWVARWRNHTGSRQK